MKCHKLQQQLSEAFNGNGYSLTEFSPSAKSSLILGLLAGRCICLDIFQFCCCLYSCCDNLQSRKFLFDNNIQLKNCSPTVKKFGATGNPYDCLFRLILWVVCTCLCWGCQNAHSACILEYPWPCMSFKISVNWGEKAGAVTPKLCL